ncbi:hypothetical protein DIPPA_08481 [Diplonema papillatum]|nr:hypothetical protein DIPPA_08481 [Diplonema papillatum]
MAGSDAVQGRSAGGPPYAGFVEEKRVCTLKRGIAAIFLEMIDTILHLKDAANGRNLMEGLVPDQCDSVLKLVQEDVQTQGTLRKSQAAAEKRMDWLEKQWRTRVAVVAQSRDNLLRELIRLKEDGYQRQAAYEALLAANRQLAAWQKNAGIATDTVLPQHFVPAAFHSPLSGELCVPTLGEEEVSIRSEPKKAALDVFRKTVEKAQQQIETKRKYGQQSAAQSFEAELEAKEHEVTALTLRLHQREADIKNLLTKRVEDQRAEAERFSNLRHQDKKAFLQLASRREEQATMKHHDFESSFGPFVDGLRRQVRQLQAAAAAAAGAAAGGAHPKAGRPAICRDAGSQYEQPSAPAPVFSYEAESEGDASDAGPALAGGGGGGGEAAATENYAAPLTPAGGVAPPLRVLPDFPETQGGPPRSRRAGRKRPAEPAPARRKRHPKRPRDEGQSLAGATDARQATPEPHDPPGHDAGGRPANTLPPDTLGFANGSHDPGKHDGEGTPTGKPLCASKPNPANTLQALLRQKDRRHTAELQRLHRGGENAEPKEQSARRMEELRVQGQGKADNVRLKSELADLAKRWQYESSDQRDRTAGLQAGAMLTPPSPSRGDRVALLVKKLEEAHLRIEALEKRQPADDQSFTRCSSQFNVRPSGECTPNNADGEGNADGEDNADSCDKAQSVGKATLHFSDVDGRASADISMNKSVDGKERAAPYEKQSHAVLKHLFNVEIKQKEWQFSPPRSVRSEKRPDDEKWKSLLPAELVKNVEHVQAVGAQVASEYAKRKAAKGVQQGVDVGMNVPDGAGMVRRVGDRIQLKVAQEQLARGLCLRPQSCDGRMAATHRSASISTPAPFNGCDLIAFFHFINLRSLQLKQANQMGTPAEGTVLLFVRCALKTVENRAGAQALKKKRVS